MYSVLMSKFSVGFPIIREELKKIINVESKVVVIPWSFAKELESKDIKEFFCKDNSPDYYNALYSLGIKDNNIVVLDCYNNSKEDMIKEINSSDVIVLTGGNPEMLYNKIKSSGIIDVLKKYKKTIIGSSAGAELQLKKYFITKKNNYYNKFAWYDGLGIINNDFYFDVHSVNKGRYLPSLRERSKEIKKDIYCLFDTGIIICNRCNNEIKIFGDVIKYSNK